MGEWLASAIIFLECPMRRSSLPNILAAAALFFAAGAEATSFDFELNYLGGNQVEAAAGSQLPTGTMLDPGDSFTYSLLAQPGMVWTVKESADYFAVFALSAGESARRVGDATVVLSLSGQQVFTFSETDMDSAYVHVGANTVPMVAGLTFDRLEFSYSLTSAAGCEWNAENTDCIDTGELSDTTLGSSLPIFGAPEFTSPTGFGYAAAVPEPHSAALLFVGLLPVAIALRSRRRDQAPA